MKQFGYIVFLSSLFYACSSKDSITPEQCLTFNERVKGRTLLLYDETNGQGNSVIEAVCIHEDGGYHLIHDILSMMNGPNLGAGATNIVQVAPTSTYAIAFKGQGKVALIHFEGDETSTSYSLSSHQIPVSGAAPTGLYVLDNNLFVLDSADMIHYYGIDGQYLSYITSWETGPNPIDVATKDSLLVVVNGSENGRRNNEENANTLQLINLQTSAVEGYIGTKPGLSHVRIEENFDAVYVHRADPLHGNDGSKGGVVRVDLKAYEEIDSSAIENVVRFFKPFTRNGEIHYFDTEGHIYDLEKTTRMEKWMCFQFQVYLMLFPQTSINFHT